jgi:hypothetical protein
VIVGVANTQQTLMEIRKVEAFIVVFILEMNRRERSLDDGCDENI